MKNKNDSRRLTILMNKLDSNLQVLRTEGPTIEIQDTNEKQTISDEIKKVYKEKR